ncbi:hypothetical protein CEXT_361101 [Caerostris extrusa]|uniref:Uncharacterized protein n=1 Tax=Caerostris extrusa TaxID=172846 RepID=A0AAV4MHU2_CAEEX|nr:hypothetical protein CEXT_361101 [Caerostris extrusa]
MSIKYGSQVRNATTEMDCAVAAESYYELGLHCCRHAKCRLSLDARICLTMDCHTSAFRLLKVLLKQTLRLLKPPSCQSVTW